MAIQRIDSDTTHAWQVRVRKCSRLFSDSDYKREGAGKNKKPKAAIAYERDLKALLPARRIVGARVVYKINRSGNWSKFAASAWRGHDGKAKMMIRSIERHGLKDALMACALKKLEGISHKRDLYELVYDGKRETMYIEKVGASHRS